MSDVYRKMPKTVRVGCFSYAVTVIEEEGAEIAGIAGAMHSLRQRIRIRAGMTPHQVANTFIHEVLHAIHYVYGLSDDSDEETFTELTANGMCAFWQDNPEACKWWQSLLKLKN